MFFKLSEGREAHEFLERGSSACKVLLIPDDEFYDYCPFYWKTRSQFETYLPKASLRLELLILKRMARMKEKIDGGDIEQLEQLKLWKRMELRWKIDVESK